MGLRKSKAKNELDLHKDVGDVLKPGDIIVAFIDYEAALAQFQDNKHDNYASPMEVEGEARDVERVTARDQIKRNHTFTRTTPHHTTSHHTTPPHYATPLRV